MKRLLTFLGVSGMLALSPFVTYYLLTTGTIGPPLISYPFAGSMGLFFIGLVPEKV